MEYSIRERKIWIELVIDVVVSFYYFTSVYQLSGWDEITGNEMGLIIRNSIAFAIVGAIILHIIFIRNAKDEAKDERDHIIEARGNAFGYYTLFILCVALIGHIALQEVVEYLIPDYSTTLSGPFIIHLIALALLCASFIKSSTLLFCYRRGY